MLKLELIEDPQTAEDHLANINKRLERITQYLAAICTVLGIILGISFGSL